MKKLYLLVSCLVIFMNSFFCEILDPEKKDKSIYYLLATALLSNSPISNIESPIATRVYGQGGSFISNGRNRNGVSASSLAIPNSVLLDKNNGLYISDYFNHRVLYYPSGETTATRVYGQNGSFISNSVNNGGITADSLSFPSGLALDSNDGLYIADDGNHRVLYYPSGVTTATRVYGQNGSFTSADANNGGLSSSSLNGPVCISLDSSNGLYIADQANNRVLYYPSEMTTAIRVYGKDGSFTFPFINSTSANSLFLPSAVSIDLSNNLYIADNGHSRVLYYPSGTTTATRVYGQNGSFTSSILNNGGISADSLNSPRGGLQVDSNGGLYISDSDNNRVLYYPTSSTTATKVYGQNGNFNTNLRNHGKLPSAATSLSFPLGIAIDSNNRIYIVDATNNRVLYY